MMQKTEIHIFADRRGKSSISTFANTYAFELDGRWYILDTSCGKKRYRELRVFTTEHPCSMVLCTHYHNDHIANNGRVGRKNTPVIYHYNAQRKIRWLRTNSTGQIMTMYNELDRYGFLRRLGFFSNGAIGVVKKFRILSDYIMPWLLFFMAWILSIRMLGRIYTGRKRIAYLEPGELKNNDLGGFKIPSWKIADGLFAIETPGHSDCHIAYYTPGNHTLFCGDALNFLSPNDIQFGSIGDVLKSQKLILEMVKKLHVERICMGHYDPVNGNSEIIDYIKDIIHKHEYMYRLVSEFLTECGPGKTFSELYTELQQIDDEIIKKLIKITFPRSTLVFLDVYLLKMIREQGIELRED
jgi:glyoxylase-like metal-dependent hydrolase (beta-lactamase superfamily II)